MRKKKQGIFLFIVFITIGLTTLMIFMFKGIKYWVEYTTKDVELQASVKQIVEPEVPFRSLIVGVVNEVKGDKLTLFDIQKRQVVVTTLTELTEVKDDRGKRIPISEIKVGEIVEIGYEPAKDNLISVTESGEAWIKTALRNVKWNKRTSSMEVGNRSYYYTENTLILDSDYNKLHNIHFINAYDTLELIGVSDQIYSIRVVEKQGFLEIRDLPVEAVRIEIDGQQKKEISSEEKVIPVSSGAHRLGVYVEGYEPLIKTINIVSGEVTSISLEGLVVLKKE